MDNEIQWSIIDRTGIVIWTGDFYINDNNDLHESKEYYVKGNLYDIIRLNSTQFSPTGSICPIRLVFYNENKQYCYNQVQLLKNKYENNFPEMVYINGEATCFKYTESIFEILAKYYKRYE